MGSSTFDIRWLWPAAKIDALPPAASIRSAGSGRVQPPLCDAVGGWTAHPQPCTICPMRHWWSRFTGALVRSRDVNFFASVNLLFVLRRDPSRTNKESQATVNHLPQGWKSNGVEPEI